MNANILFRRFHIQFDMFLIQFRPDQASDIRQRGVQAEQLLDSSRFKKTPELVDGMGHLLDQYHSTRNTLLHLRFSQFPVFV